MIQPREIPHADVLRQVFRIDPHWRLERHRKSGGWELCSKKRGGSPYFTVCHDGKLFLSHRIIWALHYGSAPAGLLDHINGQPWDNRIENLREATYSQNRMNTKNTRVNKNGYPNVVAHWKKFMAKVGVNGEMKMSPAFDDAELAGLAAQEMIRRYHGEYARRAA